MEAKIMRNKTFSESDSEVVERQAFAEWMVKHNKQYVDNTEREKRFKIFQRRYREVEAHNSLPNQSWTKGLYAFSDMTHEEFAKTHCGYDPGVDPDTQGDRNMKLGLTYRGFIPPRSIGFAFPRRDISKMTDEELAKAHIRYSYPEERPVPVKRQ